MDIKEDALRGKIFILNETDFGIGLMFVGLLSIIYPVIGVMFLIFSGLGLASMKTIKGKLDQMQQENAAKKLAKLNEQQKTINQQKEMIESMFGKGRSHEPERSSQ